MILALILALAVSPEDCLKGGQVSVAYGGKTYRLADEQCKQQFLEDPERYSQLYDALLELGDKAKPPKPASLVPS